MEIGVYNKVSRNHSLLCTLQPLNKRFGNYYNQTIVNISKHTYIVSIFLAIQCIEHFLIYMYEMEYINVSIYIYRNWKQHIYNELMNIYKIIYIYI